MRIYVIFLVLFSTLSCSNRISEDDLKHLSGNWEIQTVVFANGGEKHYKINETIDRFEMKGRSGIRKKIRPQFDGTYAETGQLENVQVIQTNNGIILKYSTPFSKWEETITELDSDRMVLTTKEKTEYHYKRPVPFDIK